MKRPRVTIARLMVAVALIGVLVGVPLRWAMWLKGTPFPVSGGVQVRLQAPRGEAFAGQAVPVEVGYDFQISGKRPPAGIFFKIRIDAIVEDRTTGAVVSRYTFYRHVIAGMHSEAAGAVRIQARHVRPGPYYLKFTMAYRTPFGTWEAIGSGASGYSVRAPHPGHEPTTTTPR